MKFGHAFQEALKADSYPRHWVEKAVPYRQLKKILGRVREELVENGYGPDTLHRLLADHNAEYRLESDDFRLLRPKLVVRPRLSAISLAQGAESGTPAELTCSAPDGANHGLLRRCHDPDVLDDDEWVRIPLDSDARFFKVLQTDVSELDTLQEQERHSMQGKIHALGAEISGLARPRRSFVTFSKSDLYRWREIFELYLAAQVFFSTAEASGGLQGSAKARKQLVWFQDEVAKRQLLQKFKVQSSATAYASFLALNATLLQNLQFQELNQTAITKIIKKFDKQTSLGVKTTFPKLMYSAQFISESISKDICAQLAREVVSLVPQVVDFSCSICLSICWLPVRLDCDHLFCIRCMIKMQHANKRYCPLCRADVVQRANENHIDNNLVRFLEKWFPKETREKQVYNELERRKELLGEAYVDNTTDGCVVM
ncbi:SPX domain-containing protein [Madurella fahalii]|uniref:SPX domain-containing protein n=1 Tax=Madurella fahalii TaxID=1157608 RepID=A0ABQ0GHQ9_9PEZI